MGLRCSTPRALRSRTSHSAWRSSRHTAPDGCEPTRSGSKAPASSPRLQGHMRKLLLLIAVLLVPAALAAGCGNNDEAASGASELVPAGSVMYGEADLAPEGDQKQAIDLILSKFPDGQAGLADLIEKGLRESDAPISFKKDIEPWLGDEAAFFVGGIGQSGDAKASAALVATTDEDRARAALEKSAEGKITKHDYKDVEYLTDSTGDAGAVFDGFLVLGTEDGLKAVIDTSKGGEKLS